jgi:glutathione peroxidase
VNGENRHPLYEQLTKAPDAEGKAGDITWNFEKFLVSPGRRGGGTLPVRSTTPEDAVVVDAITANLPA